MRSHPTLDTLIREATDRTALAQDDPEERYHLRRSFYRRYGFGEGVVFGYGISELTFLRWEIERGVLNPLDHASRPGSRWWRSVNDRLLFSAELGALAHEVGLRGAHLPRDVRLWLDYLSAPSVASWYRAHNGSIVSGYLSYAHEALLETDAERRLLGSVLDRLLFAHAMVLPGALPVGDDGAWASRMADPRGPLVSFVLRSKALYPRCYPLVAGPDRRAERAWTEDLVDERVVRPLLPAIHAAAGAAIEMPELPLLTRGGAATYPDYALPRGPEIPAHSISTPARREAADASPRRHAPCEASQA